MAVSVETDRWGDGGGSGRRGGGDASTATVAGASVVIADGRRLADVTEVMVATKVAVADMQVDTLRLLPFLLLEVVVTFGGRRQMEVMEFDMGDGDKRGNNSSAIVVAVVSAV